MTPPLERIEEPAAEADPDPGSRFVVLGSVADVDVRLEGDEVVLETGALSHRFAAGRWSAGPKANEAAPGTLAGALTTWSLPWTNGTTLLAGPAADGFLFRGDDDVDVPDTSALAVKPWLGDYPELASATEPTAGRFYALGASDKGDFGMFEWSAARGATFTKLPMRHAPYAIYPVAVIARAEGDVWAFASTTSGAGFGADFPGCPIIVRHSQDGGYVAHFDGQAWREMTWPGKEHIQTASLTPDGSIAITAGWPEDMPAALLMTGTVPPQEHWRLETKTATFTRGASPESERASRLGWALDGETVRDHGAIVALPAGDRDDERYVPIRIVAVTAEDVFVLAKVMHDADDSGERVWLRTH